MFLTNLFKLKKECSHDKITPDMDLAYCPDCGRLVANEWFITRCACCGVKLKTNIRNGKIIPQYHFCSNCGSKDFFVEKLEKINFIDINFAAHQKKIIENDLKVSSTQCWQEKTNEPQKLLGQYL